MLSEIDRAAIEPHVKRMVSLTWSRMPSHISMEDMEGAAWEGVCKAAERYDPERGASFKTYAMIRAHGEMMDQWRKDHMLSRHGFDGPVLRHTLEWDDDFGIYGRTPALDTDNVLSHGMVEKLVAMPERTREMFIRYFWLGETQREIGEELGLSESRVAHVIATQLDRLNRKDIPTAGSPQVAMDRRAGWARMPFQEEQ